MKKSIDLTGQKFNKLTIISYSTKGKWLCVCDCGTKITVSSTHFKSGHTLITPVRKKEVCDSKVLL